VTSSINIIDRFVGSRAKSKREYLSITEESAAGVLEIAVHQLQELERGACRFKAEELEKLKTLFGISLGYFFEGFGLPSENKGPLKSSEAA
jgi:transcriptional regulator with XRE-family HTH domain